MRRERLGTLYAGLTGLLLLASALVTSVLLLPEIWRVPAGILSLPDNYLQFVDDNSTYFRLTHLLLTAAMVGAVFLIFHLRPNAEAEDSGNAVEAPLPWMVLVGMTGAIVLAIVAAFDFVSVPALARIAASGSQTAIADWAGQVATWTRWLPAVGWALFSVWLLWQTPNWQGWRGQLLRLLGRYGILLAVFVLALPLNQRQTGREFVVEALFWMLLGVWCLGIANLFWSQELKAVYGLED